MNSFKKSKPVWDFLVVIDGESVSLNSKGMARLQKLESMDYEKLYFEEDLQLQALRYVQRLCPSSPKPA